MLNDLEKVLHCLDVDCQLNMLIGQQLKAVNHMVELRRYVGHVLLQGVNFPGISCRNNQGQGAHN